MSVNWKEWYAKARRKSPYQLQMEEVADILKDINFDDVLDVGCGDARLQSIFTNKFYVGIDQNYNGLDLLQQSTWDLQGAPPYDLAISSLVLMLFNETRARYIFDQMLKVSKHVFIYEECSADEEKQTSEEKWNHDYAKWGEVIKEGISKHNKNWRYFLFKGANYEDEN